MVALKQSCCRKQIQMVGRKLFSPEFSSTCFSHKMMHIFSANTSAYYRCLYTYPIRKRNLLTAICTNKHS